MARDAGLNMIPVVKFGGGGLPAWIWSGNVSGYFVIRAALHVKICSGTASTLLVVDPSFFRLLKLSSSVYSFVSESASEHAAPAWSVCHPSTFSRQDLLWNSPHPSGLFVIRALIHLGICFGTCCFFCRLTRLHFIFMVLRHPNTSWHLNPLWNCQHPSSSRSSSSRRESSSTTWFVRRSSSPVYSPSSPNRSPSPTYSPGGAETLVPRQRWSSLCGRLHMKSMTQLRDMESKVMDLLEARLQDDPEYVVMHMALQVFFRWADSVAVLEEEMGEGFSTYLVLLEDAYSKALSQSLCNRKLLSKVDRHRIDCLVDLRLWNGDHRPSVDVTAASHRVDFYANAVRVLEARQGFLDKEVDLIARALQSTSGLATDFFDLKDRLETCLWALENLIPF
ncbi:hypothetical protein Leryth_023651 [Lithospermum erythrorhizon]|nr:hypothetical protein Leryth_023651 [Lithospermum erythrorhizon]